VFALSSARDSASKYGFARYVRGGLYCKLMPSWYKNGAGFAGKIADRFLPSIAERRGYKKTALVYK